MLKDTWTRRTALALVPAAVIMGGLFAVMATSSAASPVPLPAPLAGQSLVQEFSPATLAGSTWNPSNQPGNCPNTNNGAKVNAAGYAEIDTTGANGDCRSMQSPAANMPTKPGTTYEALVNFSSFHDWPALWMYGPNWPNQGEIDAVEGGPGASFVTWHQAGNHTIGPDAWDDQVVPYAGMSHDIQPGTWTTVDISFTSTGVDVYYNGSLYVHIPESVTTAGNDPMYLTVSEGSCNSSGANVCNGGTSPAGSVQVQWIREFSASAPAPTPTATTPTPTPTVTTPAPTPTPTPTQPDCTAATAPTAAPASIAASVTGSHVVVHWDAVSQAADYQVRVILPSGHIWMTNDITLTNQATFAMVPQTGNYTYQVRALNGAGFGPWSAVQSFTVTQLA
jgi:hypothetical protein